MFTSTETIFFITCLLSYLVVTPDQFHNIQCPSHPSAFSCLLLLLPPSISTLSYQSCHVSWAYSHLLHVFMKLEQQRSACAKTSLCLKTKG